MNKEIGEIDTYNVCSWGKLGKEKEGWRKGERGGREKGRERRMGKGEREKGREGE